MIGITWLTLHRFCGVSAFYALVLSTFAGAQTVQSCSLHDVGDSFCRLGRRRGPTATVRVSSHQGSGGRSSRAPCVPRVASLCCFAGAALLACCVIGVLRTLCSLYDLGPPGPRLGAPPRCAVLVSRLTRWPTPSATSCALRSRSSVALWGTLRLRSAPLARRRISWRSPCALPRRPRDPRGGAAGSTRTAPARPDRTRSGRGPTTTGPEFDEGSSRIFAWNSSRRLLLCAVRSSFGPLCMRRWGKLVCGLLMAPFCMRGQAANGSAV